MNSSVPDYKKLYQLQDKVLFLLKDRLSEFYLTGGTALGRFYLQHRFSDDLDFFIHDNERFRELTALIYSWMKNNLKTIPELLVDSADFMRIWIDEEISMKVEFVRDTGTHVGKPIEYQGILIDNPLNILANKIGAMLSRDEAKDVFDIVILASAYAFNWRNVYLAALSKQIMNEQDVLMRLSTFPTEWISEQKWLKESSDTNLFKQHLEIICDDFLLGNDNSLGKGKPPIEEARPKLLG